MVGPVVACENDANWDIPVRNWLPSESNGDISHWSVSKGASSSGTTWLAALQRGVVAAGEGRGLSWETTFSGGG